ncbi:MAG TPA: hypothetical protein VJT75_12260 [Thermoleophilaceae bacterium]|nr:hypothetical protein [Thermoleophilaceae bacterium]
MRRVLTPDIPFDGGTAFDGSRPLRIVLDDALGGGEAETLLRGFARHGLVEIFATGEGHSGVALILHDELDRYGNLPYEVRRPGSRAQPRGLHNAQQWRHIALQMTQQFGASDADDTRRELILTQIARDLGADAFATRSEFVLDQAPRGIVERANPMTPNEAMALMGLYLRLRGDFTVFMGEESYTYSMDRGLWYWVLTRDMLRSGWRWFGACVRSSTASGDDALILLGQSTLRRFDRALRARDHVLQQFHLPPDNNTSDEALFYLDVVLLMLSGAFDAAAQVAHTVYGLTGKTDDAGWRKGPWRKKLGAVEPAFATLLADESQTRDAMDLVGLLRNTIHGEALRGIAYEEHGKPRRRENLVLLPAQHRTRLLDAVARRGGGTQWGLRRGDEVAVEGDTFLEALIPEVARALNDLMDATNVMRLPGVSAANLPEPPTDPGSEFSPHHSRFHRLLAGLA